ncbi:MAG: hypothetical protein U0Q16_19145 [Bryobacteraceae bacterium]
MNRQISRILFETASLLEQQGAGGFRVRAYRHAAGELLHLVRPIEEIYRAEGEAGIQTQLDVGERMAATIAHVILYGELPLLNRLRRHGGAENVLETVPGIGRVLANHLSHDLGIETLEDLEAAAYDGRLAHAGFGAKRIAGIRDSLGSRLGKVRQTAPPDTSTPPLTDLLDIDREYRERAAAGTLRTIAPRRFNPDRASWLPILRTERGSRVYTALFSNTARAHQLGRTRDWVVIYEEAEPGRRPSTVVTAHRGPLSGKRVVRGREAECQSYYAPVSETGVNAAGSAPPPELRSPPPTA